MAAIDLTKSVITPIAVGVLDEALERIDDAAGRTEYRRWSALARLFAVAGGHAATMMGRGLTADLGASVATAYTPLLVKSLAANVVKKQGGSPSYFTPRRVVAGAHAREDLAPQKVFRIGV